LRSSVRGFLRRKDSVKVAGVRADLDRFDEVTQMLPTMDEGGGEADMVVEREIVPLKHSNTAGGGEKIDLGRDDSAEAPPAFPRAHTEAPAERREGRIDVQMLVKEFYQKMNAPGPVAGGSVGDSVQQDPASVDAEVLFDWGTYQNVVAELTEFDLAAFKSSLGYINRGDEVALFLCSTGLRYLADVNDSYKTAELCEHLMGEDIDDSHREMVAEYVLTILDEFSCNTNPDDASQPSSRFMQALKSDRLSSTTRPSNAPTSEFRADPQGLPADAAKKKGGGRARAFEDLQVVVKMIDLLESADGEFSGMLTDSVGPVAEVAAQPVAGENGAAEPAQLRRLQVSEGMTETSMRDGSQELLSKGVSKMNLGRMFSKRGRKPD